VQGDNAAARKEKKKEKVNIGTEGKKKKKDSTNVTKSVGGKTRDNALVQFGFREMGPGRNKGRKGEASSNSNRG